MMKICLKLMYLDIMTLDGLIKYYKYKNGNKKSKNLKSLFEK